MAQQLLYIVSLLLKEIHFDCINDQFKFCSSPIVQLIFHFWFFEISRNIQRTQEYYKFNLM